MSTKKITLVSSHLTHDGRPTLDTNLSVPILTACIGERVRQHVSVDVSTVFPYLEVGEVCFPSSVVGDVLENDPELVGVSCWLWDVDAMLDLASQIKAANWMSSTRSIFLVPEIFDHIPVSVTLPHEGVDRGNGPRAHL